MDPFFGTVNVGTPFSGSYTFESGSPDLIADPQTAPYQIGCDGGSACPDLTMQIFFQDNTGTVFSSDALPLSPPPIASFATRAFHLAGTFGGNLVQIDGAINTLDAVTVTAVPEPSSLLPVGSGVSIALVRRWRNRRRDRTTAA